MIMFQMQCFNEQTFIKRIGHFFKYKIPSCERNIGIFPKYHEIKQFHLKKKNRKIIKNHQNQHNFNLIHVTHQKIRDKSTKKGITSASSDSSRSGIFGARITLKIWNILATISLSEHGNALYTSRKCCNEFNDLADISCDNGICTE